VDLVSLGLLLGIALLFIKLSLGYVAQSWSLARHRPTPAAFPSAGR
jgi:hypothetical protein